MSDTFDKLSVLDSFIEEVNSYLPEIETNLDRLAQSPDDIDTLEETYRRTHTIGGSAAMMDFRGLSHVAHGMEDILGDVLDGVAKLDPPTIGLLQRSLVRLRRLLQGIHGKVDEDAVMAEDDADYTQYRASIELSVQAGHNETPLFDEQARMSHQLQSAESSIPSLDEMLASFRAPAVNSGEDVAWPEEPVPLVSFERHPHQSPQPETQSPLEPEPQKNELTSALDVLVATTKYPSTANAPSVVPGEKGEIRPSTESQSKIREKQTELATAHASIHETSFTGAYNEVQEEAHVLEEQTTVLQNTLAQLRLAASVVETQRTEFRGFLDGSKDALDRMEEWAGQAMGLNLRNSPEQVRRYLPLSVMWVANSKLKKVLDLLNQLTQGVVGTDEQMQKILRQLQASIEVCRSAFWQLQADASSNASHTFTQETGWSPWEMRTPAEPGMVQERVTFERRGDPAALRAEIEVHLREELRREYESRPFTLAARAELERQIRQEVQEEVEAKRQLQERLSGSEKRETTQEIEARVRNEIEIQIRREFLDQLVAGVVGEEAMNAASSSSVRPTAPLAPTPSLAPSRTANFADQAREAVGLSTPSPLPTIQTPSLLAFAQPSASLLPTEQLVSARTSLNTPTSISGDFGEEAAEIFRLEAEEHLQTISLRVAALEKSPDDRDLIQGIRRATHTLKGAAAMMGFRAIADLCHISEDLLDSIMEGTTAISLSVLSIILDTAEALDVLINGRGAEPASGEAMAHSLRARYVELLGEQISVTEEELDVDEEPILGSSLVAEVVDGTHATETHAQRAARGDLSVRVRLRKLDELVNLFGELLVNRSLLEEHLERLDRLVADVGISSTRLRDVGQKLESRFEAATLPSGRSLQVIPVNNGNQNVTYSLVGNRENNPRNLIGVPHLTDFDELELDRYTEFHQLSRGLSEGISDMTTLSTEMEAVIRDCQGVFARESRLSTTFQDRLLKARLVPLSMMIPRLYRSARSVALKQGKEFDFLIEGEATEVDRTVSEEIAGPLLHLVRNAVNHALETPEVRHQRGKPPVGQIKLSAAYEGNQVVITVSDDGTGIDPVRVRNAAIARGLIKPDQVLSDNDVIGLIFQPGFSTAEALSEESGRGVGLDVVRDSVARLRGTLAVEYMPSRGTAFTMKFPTSLAIQSAMLVRASGQQFAIPMVMIEAIGRLDNFKRSTLGSRQAIVVRNELYPLSMLAQLLSLPAGPLEDKAQLLLVNTAGQRVALVVNEIKGKVDVVMKNLGPHLRKVPGIAGGTVLGNGRVVLILEILELLSSKPGLVGPSNVPIWREGVLLLANQTASQSGAALQSASDRRGVTFFASPPASAAVLERGKHILVIDDSPSVRRVVSDMLKQRGWQVQMARDGVEALEMITNETPAAVLLDIEMPRMDGFELMATVRAQEQYRALPLVVLTSRAGAKHQQRAMQLGANAYVVKPYQDEELLNTLNALVYGAPTS